MNPTTLVKSPRRKTGDTYAFPDIGTPAWREIYHPAGMATFPAGLFGDCRERCTTCSERTACEEER